MKGFTFSVDALIAVLIAIVGVTAVVAITSTGRTEATEMGPLQAAGQDLLTVMDKNGTFKEMFNQSDMDAANAANASLWRLLPPQLVARLNITICSYTGSDFSCTRNIIVQTNTSEMPFKSVARRVFANAQENKYGVAFLEVGYGNFGASALKYNGASCSNSSECYSSHCDAGYNTSSKYCCPSGSLYCCASDSDCGGDYPVCTTNSNCSGITSITVSPGSVNLGASGTQQFTAQCSYAGTIRPCSPGWTADAAIGSVNSSGFFTAGTSDASGTVNATIGSIVGTAQVSVNGTLLINGASCTNSTECLSGYCGESYNASNKYCCPMNSTYCCSADADCGGSLTTCGANKSCTTGFMVFVFPNPAVVNVTKAQQFSASCYSEGLPIACPLTPVWNVTGGIGTVNSTGYFTAGASLKNGTINATVNLTMGYSNVRVVYGNGVECSHNSSCASEYCGPTRVGNKDYCCTIYPSIWCCTKQSECGGAYPTCAMAPEYNCR